MTKTDAATDRKGLLAEIAALTEERDRYRQALESIVSLQLNAAGKPFIEAARIAYAAIGPTPAPDRRKGPRRKDAKTREQIEQEQAELAAWQEENHQRLRTSP